MRQVLLYGVRLPVRFRLVVLASCALAWISLFSGCHKREDNNLPIQQCVRNLKVIDGAKMIWTLQNHKVNGDVPTDADLFGPGKELQERPQCPMGGTYRLGMVGERPTCNEPGHVIDRTFE